MNKRSAQATPADAPVRRPRALFVGPYPPPYSGPELGMKLFLESSLGERFDIRFLKTNFRSSNRNKGRAGIRAAMQTAHFFVRLIYVLLRHRPDVVYYPVTPTKVGWLGRDSWCLILCRLCRVPSIIHLRGSHLRLNFATFPRWLQRLAKFACRDVRIALVQANVLRDQFYPLVRASRVRVLYQALDTEEYTNPAPADYEPHRILFLGHMTQAKGYCDLVRAIPIVARRLPDAQFYFGGTLRRGERGVFFNQTTGERLVYEDPVVVHEEVSSGPYARNYVYLGMLDGIAKLRELQACSAFVLPSYSEGFSRAVLEALSMGKPVVCTPVGAHREVIVDGEHGKIVSPGDVGCLAAAILSLLENRAERDHIGLANAQYARSRFDIAIIARQLGDYLMEAIHA